MTCREPKPHIQSSIWTDKGFNHRLNVSRETLQANKFIQQLKSIIVRKALDLFTRLSKDDVGNFKKFSEVYGTAMRVGILETSSKKDIHKLASLLRFSSTRSEFTSLDEVSGKATPSLICVTFCY